MSILAFVAGVAFMALGVALSIALHEVGHLVPAKRFGVRVTQYMVGFGPTVWSRRRGETEYGVKAIPLGGYIRMIGMFPPRKGQDPGTVRVSSTGRLSQLVDEARAASLEEVRPGDENRVFYRLTVPKKLAVMLGGPVMNLLIGVVLLTIVVTVHGLATAQPGAEVATVSKCVAPVTEAATATSCEGLAPTPALEAGLRPGDRFVSIAGQPVDETTDVGEIVRPRIGQATEIVVVRDGEELTLTAIPIRNVVPVLDANGLPVVREDGTYTTTEAGFLGVRSRGSSGPPSAAPRRRSSTSPSGWSACGTPRSAAPSASSTARCRSSASAGWPARSVPGSTTSSSATPRPTSSGRSSASSRA